MDVCVFCCNVSTIILRLWGQGGNKCTCFRYHHPHDTEVLECGRYRRGGAEETAGSLQGLAWMSAAGLGFRASLRLAGCLTWYPVLWWAERSSLCVCSDQWLLWEEQQRKVLLMKRESQALLEQAKVYWKILDGQDPAASHSPHTVLPLLGELIPGEATSEHWIFLRNHSELQRSPVASQIQGTGWGEFNVADSNPWGWLHEVGKTADFSSSVRGPSPHARTWITTIPCILLPSLGRSPQTEELCLKHKASLPLTSSKPKSGGAYLKEHGARAASAARALWPRWELYSLI